MLAAVLAALRVAERTGEGQVVDVSLMHTATWTMAADLSSVLIDGHQPSKRVRDQRLAVIATAFRCSDDRFLILNMLEQRWWRPFCETLGHPEWVDDERFATPRARFDEHGRDHPPDRRGVRRRRRPTSGRRSSTTPG